MPQATVRLPDGRTATLSVPEGTTNQQIQAAAKRMYDQGKFDQDFSTEAPSELGRSFAQGLTFGFSDEIEAAVRSVLPESVGGGEYSAIRDELRGRLKEYKDQNPGAAITAEVAGAIVPSIIATVMTGGAGAAPSLARIAGISAAEGAAYGLGTSEKESLGQAAMDTAVGGGIGAIAGPALTGAIRGVSGGADKFMSFVKEKFGDTAGTAVQAELRRLQEQTGNSTEQILEDIASGRVMAANRTLTIALKNYVNEGGKAGKATLEGARQAARQATDEATVQLKRQLGADADLQATKLFDEGQKARRVVVDKAYDAVEEAAPQNDLPFESANVLQDVVGRVPQMADRLNEAYTIRGIVPLLRVGANGAIELVRRPTIRDGEILRKRLKDEVTKAFNAGDGDMAKALGKLEKQLRSELDKSSPTLATARAGYAIVKGRADAFDLGSRSLNKPLDDIENAMDEYVDDPEALSAFRLGLLRQIRDKAATSSTTMARLADDDKKIGQVLRIALKDQDIAELERKLGLAGDLQEIKSKLPAVAGSPSLPLLRESQRSGATPSVADMASVTMGNPLDAAQAIARIGKAIAGRNAPGLTDEQRMEVVQVLFSRDPELVRKALTDNTALEKLIEKYGNILGTAGAGLRRGAVSQTASEDGLVR